MQENQKSAQVHGASFFFLPFLNGLFGQNIPAYADKSKLTVLKKGFNINLKGAAKREIDENVKVNTFAVQPPNFRGVAPIPKVLVAVGDNVKAGDPLFHDKTFADIKYVAPVSGEVIAINRGERRAITEIVILADKKQEYRMLPSFDLSQSSRQELVSFLLDSGVWASFRQRPFDVIAGQNDTPDNIFVTTFDTAPLAPDLDLVVEGKAAAFQKGLEVLNKLTPGKVFLGLDANGKKAPSSIFTDAKGVEKRWFYGKHPAGNVGIQIHHTAPIGSKSLVWTIGVQDVITLGALFTENRYNAERIIALAGAELNEPKYVRTSIGANIGDLLKGNLKHDHIRIISGDILTGQAKKAENFLNFYDDQITVVEEGDYFETFGWLIPDKSTPSVSRSFTTALTPNKKFKADTNLHGEKRAFVVTGEYESLLPMDIYPQHLMKAILANDYEKMEGLGLLELIEEDIALCEFACTSKQPLQQILRTGLNMLMDQ
jgi:Na+-transporting NADH:ubiquinone oxidoreductase subunit A